MDTLLENKSTPKKKEEKKKAISVFDYIKQIDTKKEKIEYDDKKCPGYILLMHYSHDNSVLKIANEINKYLYLIDNKYIYQYLYHKIPKQNRFVKWIKKDKEKNEKVQKLMELYDISYREALESVI